MRKSLWILVLCIVVVGTSSVSAKTPDGKPPSVETVCDNETGAAYGLCTSFCEAKDCDDPNHRASDQACESVKKNFEKKTGRTLPCLKTCPCPGVLQLFADIASGGVIVTRCIVDDNFLFLRTVDGDEGFVEEGPPANCNVNNDPLQTLVLTAEESLVCRVMLRQLVESMGVQCTGRE